MKLLETNPKMKPGYILQNLEKTKVEIPLLADLNNFLATFRKKQISSQMNLDPRLSAQNTSISTNGLSDNEEDDFKSEDTIMELKKSKK